SMVTHIWNLCSAFNPSECTNTVNTHPEYGETVTIVCSYSWASTNIKALKKNLKYFCRDPCTYKTSVRVSSDQSLNGRYRLDDLGNGSSTVNITDLQESDSGIYWCGVKRPIRDTYDKVTLTVSKGKNDSFSSCRCSSLVFFLDESQVLVSSNSVTGNNFSLILNHVRYTFSILWQG
uniref:Ig-like domain-containing protein n=1 Tax=Cyprinus carpio carpio TaxID=630221 RepID=A0A9J7ZKU4_CYPCA